MYIFQYIDTICVHTYVHIIYKIKIKLIFFFTNTLNKYKISILLL